MTRIQQDGAVNTLLALASSGQESLEDVAARVLAKCCETQVGIYLEEM